LSDVVTKKQLLNLPISGNYRFEPREKIQEVQLKISVCTLFFNLLQ
jgi:hypothetical protein